MRHVHIQVCPEALHNGRLHYEGLNHIGIHRVRIFSRVGITHTICMSRFLRKLSIDEQVCWHRYGSRVTARLNETWR